MGKITYNKDQEEDKMSVKTEYAVKLHKMDAIVHRQ